MILLPTHSLGEPGQSSEDIWREEKIPVFLENLWLVFLEGILCILPLGPEKNHRKIVREAEVINSFKEYLLNTHQLSSTALDTRDRPINKAGKNPCPRRSLYVRSKKGTSEGDTSELLHPWHAWPWPLVIPDALPVGFTSGLHGKASHKGAGRVQDSREELREHLVPLVGGEQFLMSNRSFIKGRFERRRGNVEKEATLCCILIPCQNTGHFTHCPVSSSQALSKAIHFILVIHIRTLRFRGVCDLSKTFSL